MLYFILLILVLVFLGISDEIEITHTYIKTSKVKNEVKFAIVGDLHSCFYGEKMEKIVDLLKTENPDVLLNVGDMYDGRVDLKNSDTYFKEIQPLLSFYVSGNHELFKRKDLIYKKTISMYNTKVLEGERVQVKVDQTTVNIIGVDDIQIGDVLNQQLKKGFKDIDSNYTVLMFHRPHLIKLFKTLPVDLIVSGHAHGGQWQIPFTRRGIFAPQQGLFPKYTNGLYDLKKQLLYVTRGLAKESVKVLRLYNRPEIAIIHLVPDN